jgi:hypothetical protein
MATAEQPFLWQQEQEDDRAYLLDLVRKNLRPQALLSFE